MKVKHWKPSEKNLYGHRAIEHRITKEVCLASKRGEIWAYSDAVASVLCKTPQSLRKVLQIARLRLFGRLKRDCEGVVRLPNTLIPQVIKILNIPKTRPAQARAANEF